MRRALSLIPTAALFLSACAPGDDAPTAASSIPEDLEQYTIEEFLGTTDVFGASFSPDGSKILVSTNESGIYNAYAIPVDGGAPEQLTASTDDAVFAYSYFPDDERFLYGSDQGGNELTHIYVREPDGTVRDLTPGEGLKASFAGWAKDDQSFFMITNERDDRYFDLYEVAVEDYERTLIYQNDQGYDAVAISPDKRYVALVKPNTTLDTDVYLYDRETGETRHLTPHEGNVSTYPADFSPDGTSLYLITDEGHEFAYLTRYDLASGERTTVLQPEWDVMYAGFSDSGNYLYAAVNHDARTEIRLLEAATMEPVALPGLPDADITSVSLSPDETRLAFYASDSRTPRDLYVADLDGGEPTRLTQSLNEAIDRGHLVDAEVVRFASYDGLQVPGLLYKPHLASAENKAPALVMVHGGPGGQARVGYDALTQYLVNHGYVVFDINNRGSSGYGKTFYAMDDRKHGDADLGDVVASKQMLIETGYVDPEKVGIIGGSYGGYMVLAALAFRPDTFDVGVDIFGVANWIRTLESIPPWWTSFREALYAELGDPATDGERLRSISPLFHAANIEQPLIVLQGANDPRVLQVESDEIVEAVRANGAPVEYVVFEDEGHGFAKRENEKVGYEAILKFLDTHLKGDQDSTSTTPAI